MKVIWSRSAEDDFEAYTEARSRKGAERIGERILKSVRLLETFPEIAPPSRRHRGLRQMTIVRTPYVVVYRVTDNQVEIHAVIHGKQRRRR
jgi:plasmid stabilization system protein ParE